MTLPPSGRSSRLRSTPGFLRAALDALHEHSPGHYRELTEVVRAVPSRHQVDGERFMVATVEDRIVVRSGWRPAPIEVATSTQAVVEIIDGTVTVEALLSDGRLDVRGPADALLEFSRGVRVFMEAAVNSRAVQEVVEGYRRWASRTGPAPSVRHPDGHDQAGATA